MQSLSFSFLRLFKARLLVELNSVFPKQIGSYRAIRGDDRVAGNIGAGAAASGNSNSGAAHSGPSAGPSAGPSGSGQPQL